MRRVDPNKIPNWGNSGDEAKTAFIQSMVAEHLDPIYAHSADYLGFKAFLGPNHMGRAHHFRYLNTFGALSQFFADLKDKQILETGGHSPISTFLARRNECASTESDLRTSIDADSSSMDIVLSFEVLEHLKDPPSDDMKDIVLFRQQGAKNYASEIMRILKPGGYLVLTTPNPASYKSIERAVKGDTPMVFKAHVREYARAEIENIFNTFEIVHYETQFNFGLLKDQGRNWKNIFEKNNWDTEHRGDDHVFIFRKATAML